MKSFNWKLILLLSLFGLMMGLVSISFASSNIEPLLWFIIFPICAFIIAKKSPGRYFLHGVFLGILNSIWITVVHIIFLDAYIKHHPDEATMIINSTNSPIIVMLVTGLIVGVVSGIIFGLFALILYKTIKKAELNKQRRMQS